MRKTLLLLFALFGCSYEPTGIAMDPPVIYQQWFSEVEACSGLAGDFSQIRWSHAYDMNAYDGYWTPKHNITIRDDYRDSVRVVKHEIMHDLLQSGDHPSLYFQQVCGDLMRH